jgi:hypothetical protein
MHLCSSESTRNNRGSGVFCGSHPETIQRGYQAARIGIEIFGFCGQENLVEFRSWQLQQRIERIGGRWLRRIGKKGIRRCKEDFMYAAVTLRLS